MTGPNAPAAERHLVLVGPPHDKPCGIHDYVRRLAEGFTAAKADQGGLQVVDYSSALARVSQPQAALAGSTMSLSNQPADFLVHYERSRVPSPYYLKAFAQALQSRNKGCEANRHSRLFVVPHEVYARDPYAYDVDLIKGFWPLAALKKWRYRLQHQAWYREEALQKAGYHAHALFPLNKVAAGVLSEKMAGNKGMPRIAMQVIPHARLEAWKTQPQPAHPPAWNPDLHWVWGMTGFLSASNDYAGLFSALRDLSGHGLVLFSGARETQSDLREKIEAEIHANGLVNRVHWQGYVPEENWPDAFAQVQGFVAPWKFRSATGSLFMALATGKPVVVADLPLSRELCEQGAGIVTVTPDQWVETLRAIADGQRACPPDQYPWSYAAVAKTYREAMAQVAFKALNSSD